MTIEEVYSHFGSGANVGRALGLTRQAFNIWRKRGYVPYKNQVALERLTNGQLKANMAHTQFSRNSYADE